jgi:cytoskeletal protein CcmA (bactofilin family)
MWFDKKTRSVLEFPSMPQEEAPRAPVKVKTFMSESTSKSTIPSVPGSQRTVLGRTVVAQGQIASAEDLQIDGKFDGSISVADHILTVGPEGHVKAEIRARQVVIQGSVEGDVTAREKIEIRRSGHVEGDLVAGSIAIEEGAFFKGSIDIARNEASAVPTVPATPSTSKK